MSAMIRTHLLIDGWNFFLRHYCANPTMDTNGDPVGGVVGFVKGLRALVEQFKPSSALVVWDGEGGSERRRSIRSEYKAGRKVRLNREYDFDSTAEEEHANLRRQRELLDGYLDVLGIPHVSPAGVEADDALAYLCQSVFTDDSAKVVVSNDRDLLQLVGSHGVKVYAHGKKRLMDEAAVLEDVGCIPGNYAVVKAICGDRGDNVKGVRGVGPKTLVKLCPALRDTPMCLEEVLLVIEGLVASGGSAHAKNIMALGRGTIQENRTLVDLSSPLMSPVSARLVRSVALSQKGFNPVGIRVRAMRDGIQFQENLDVTFKQLSLRRGLWLRAVKKENDV